MKYIYSGPVTATMIAGQECVLCPGVLTPDVPADDEKVIQLKAAGLLTDFEQSPPSRKKGE